MFSTISGTSRVKKNIFRNAPAINYHIVLLFRIVGAKFLPPNNLVNPKDLSETNYSCFFLIFINGY